MPRINVFLKHQTPAVDTPLHRCSKNFALRLAAAFPRLVNLDLVACTLQLRTAEAWSSVKTRLRPALTGVRTEALNAPGYAVCNMLSYPPTGQETNARQRQRELWMNAERF